MASERHEPRSSMLGEGEGYLGKVDAMYSACNPEAVPTDLIVVLTHGVPLRRESSRSGARLRT
ncbi:hypothetical protein BFN03_08970 [Rhodococcus sp. WMMA185]|nr:hypothetical protein BFN03_08970 [Rhodococcus sp. WMMA185]